MANLDELSRIIGKLESSVQTLFHRQDDMTHELRHIRKLLEKRTLWSTVKIVSGAFIGGFSAVAAKMMIWK